MWVFFQLSDFLAIGRHGAADAAYTIISAVVKFAMLNLDDIIKEMPYIFITPFNDGIDDDFILSVDAADFAFSLFGELVLVEILDLLVDLFFLPKIELVEISCERSV